MSFHYIRKYNSSGTIQRVNGVGHGLAIRRLRGQKPLPLKSIIEILRFCADIINDAMKNGFIHGDLRMDAISISEDGSLVINGYGRPRRGGIAPEGTLSIASDLYGVGVLMLELLTNKVDIELPLDETMHNQQVLQYFLSIDWQEWTGQPWLPNMQEYLISLLLFDPSQRPHPLDVANILQEAINLTKSSTLPDYMYFNQIKVPAEKENLAAASTLRSSLIIPVEVTADSSQGLATGFWTRDKIAQMFNDPVEDKAVRREWAPPSNSTPMQDHFNTVEKTEIETPIQFTSQRPSNTNTRQQTPSWNAPPPVRSEEPTKSVDAVDNFAPLYNSQPEIGHGNRAVSIYPAQQDNFQNHPAQNTGTPVGYPPTFPQQTPPPLQQSPQNFAQSVQPPQNIPQPTVAPPPRIEQAPPDLYAQQNLYAQQQTPPPLQQLPQYNSSPPSFPQQQTQTPIQQPVIQQGHSPVQISQGQYTQQPTTMMEGSNKKMLIIGGIVIGVLLLIIAVGIAIFMFSSSNTNEATSTIQEPPKRMVQMDDIDEDIENIDNTDNIDNREEPEKIENSNTANKTKEVVQEKPKTQNTSSSPKNSNSTSNKNTTSNKTTNSTKNTTSSTKKDTTPDKTTTTVSATIQGGDFDVQIKFRGVTAKLTCGDGQTKEFAEVVTMTFKSQTTCRVTTEDGQVGVALANKPGSINCKLVDDKVQCN